MFDALTAPEARGSGVASQACGVAGSLVLAQAGGAGGLAGVLQTFQIGLLIPARKCFT